jgi:hypothetical protein
MIKLQSSNKKKQKCLATLAAVGGGRDRGEGGDDSEIKAIIGALVVVFFVHCI